MPLLSVLFVTYNRPELLTRTLQSFLKNTSYPSLELVVTDDGSAPEIQEQIKLLPVHKVVLSATNKGLGANNNAGLRQCSGKYILMLQDDWDCRGPAEYLAQAVSVMECTPRIGLIKFYGPEHVLHSERPLPGSDAPCREAMRELPDGSLQAHVYSDTPHLRSREALEHVGFYKENCRMEECEADYATRFAQQNRYTAALFPRYYNRVFIHTGEEHSLRTNTVRHRMESYVLPFARTLERHCRPLFVASRFLFRKSIELLERSRRVRS